MQKIARTPQVNQGRLLHRDKHREAELQDVFSGEGVDEVRNIIISPSPFTEPHCTPHSQLTCEKTARSRLSRHPSALKFQ